MKFTPLLFTPLANRHAGRVGVGFRREPVQIVINISNRLSFAVGLTGHVVIGIVGVRFRLRIREIGIRFSRACGSPIAHRFTAIRVVNNKKNSAQPHGLAQPSLRVMKRGQ